MAHLHSEIQLIKQIMKRQIKCWRVERCGGSQTQTKKHLILS